MYHANNLMLAGINSGDLLKRYKVVEIKVFSLYKYFGYDEVLTGTARD